MKYDSVGAIAESGRILRSRIRRKIMTRTEAIRHLNWIKISAKHHRFIHPAEKRARIGQFNIEIRKIKDMIKGRLQKRGGWSDDMVTYDS